jgi:O-antigen/teichoic acid export membrane protein
LNLKLIKNILLYGIGDFIVTGVSAFLFIPLYLNFLSTEEYGILNILNNNTLFFTYVVQFGIISAFSRIYYLKKTENLEKEYIWHLMCLHFVYSILLIIFYFSFKNFVLNSLSPSISHSRLVYYSPVMAFLTFIPALYYVYLRLIEKVNKFVQFQILTVSLIIFFISVSYIFFDVNLDSILISFILSSFIIWILALINLKYSINFKIDFKDIIETLSFAFPVFVSYIAYFFISKYSIIILQKNLSLEEIGKFSLALQIATIPSLVSIAITKAFQPTLFSINCENELKIKAQSIDKNYKLFMVWMVGSLIFFLDFLIRHFLPAYNSIIKITEYLLVINLIYNFSIVENSILLYKMKSKIILLITVCGSLTNVILSNILINSYSLNGVIISMAIAFSVNFSLDIYFSRKFVKLWYDIKTIIPCVCFVILFIPISSLNFFLTNNSYGISFTILCFVILTISIGLILKKANYDRNI